MKMIANIVTAATIISGFLFMICLMLSGAFPTGSRQSEFFAELANAVLRILLLALPVVLVCLIVSMTK